MSLKNPRINEHPPLRPITPGTPGGPRGPVSPFSPFGPGGPAERKTDIVSIKPIMYSMADTMYVILKSAAKVLERIRTR